MRSVPCADATALPAATPMQQHPCYAATLRLLGRRVEPVTLQDGGAVLGRVQIVHRRIGPGAVAWVPRGPLWLPGTDDAGKRAGLDALRAGLPLGAALLLTPQSAGDLPGAPWPGWHQLAAAQHGALLNLSTPSEARLAQMQGKWRNRLRHGEAAGTRVTVRPFDPGADQPLLARDMQQRRALGYRALPPGFTLAWALANPGSARLFLAHDATGLIAYLLILQHPPTATYHIGWTSARGRAASCHNLLLWRASTWLAERGITALDLGLCDARATPGLARFKRGTGAQSYFTGPTLLALPRLRLSRLWAKAA